MFSKTIICAPEPEFGINKIKIEFKYQFEPTKSHVFDDHVMTPIDHSSSFLSKTRFMIVISNLVNQHSESTFDEIPKRKYYKIISSFEEKKYYSLLNFIDLLKLDNSLLIIYMNYLKDDGIHKLSTMEVLDKVAKMCAQKLKDFFNTNMSISRKTDIEILSHGFGSIIGGKLGSELHSSFDLLHVKNLFGKFIFQI